MFLTDEIVIDRFVPPENEGNQKHRRPSLTGKALKLNLQNKKYKKWSFPIK